MQQLLLILHVLVAIAIIALVLMQHGRGADVGAAFGSGASNTMFGSSGSLPFLMKVTALCAAIFFSTSIALSYLATKSSRQTQIIHIPAALSQTQPSNTSEKNNTNNAGASFVPTVPESKKSSTDTHKSRN